MRPFLLLALLSGCATTHKPCPPAQLPKVEIVEVTRTVQAPCAVTEPVQPAPLTKPLPTKSDPLIAVLTAKLAEYAGQGGFSERALQAIRECKKVSEAQ